MVTSRRASRDAVGDAPLRDRDFDECGYLRGAIDGFRDLPADARHAGPARSAQYDHCDAAGRQMLLVPQILIRGDEDVKPGRLRGVAEHPVR